MKSIYKHFSKTITDYDTVADKVVFKNNEFHKQILKAIKFPKNAKLDILDLGYGTGHSIKLVAKKSSSMKSPSRPNRKISRKQIY